MKFSMIHENYNVSDLERSLEFYRQALGFEEVRLKEAADGSFIIVYVAAGPSAEIRSGRVRIPPCLPHGRF